MLFVSQIARGLCLSFSQFKAESILVYFSIEQLATRFHFLYMSLLTTRLTFPLILLLILPLFLFLRLSVSLFTELSSMLTVQCAKLVQIFISNQLTIVRCYVKSFTSILINNFDMLANLKRNFSFIERQSTTF